MLHSALIVIAVIGIVGYVIGRQLLGEPQRGKRLILLPGILTLIGALNLGKDGRHPQAIDIVFIAVSGVIAAGIGFGQGSMMRLEKRNGGLWGQLPPKSLWLWGALVASRVVIGVIAGASGAHVAASTAPILLVLGINRLAQALSIAPRAIKAGIPFAAEKDGSTFLGGLNRVAPTATPRPTPMNTQPMNTQPMNTQPSDDPTAQSPAGAPAPWQAAGAQFVTAVGGALQERRAQRSRDDRDKRDRRDNRDHRNR